jgi:hypothetical protein
MSLASLLLSLIVLLALLTALLIALEKLYEGSRNLLPLPGQQIVLAISTCLLIGVSGLSSVQALRILWIVSIRLLGISQG